MTGIFGIIDISNKFNVQKYLRSAGAVMSHLHWYQTKHWTNDAQTVGLGLLSIGIFNTEIQPAANADRSLTLMMAGEFHQSRDLRQMLKARRINPGITDSELALAAYQAWGLDFSAHLEGAFVIAVYDQDAQRLVLANDRFGLYPTYIYAERGRLVFAPEVRGVLQAPFVPRRLNHTAVAEFLRFQFLLESKTFHEAINRFTPGSVGIFHLATGSWTEQRYWDWDSIPEHPEMRFEEAAEEMGRQMRRAVEKRSSDSFRPGVFLSGGLDSRTIVGMLPKQAQPPITATFGSRACRDVYYAQQIAQAVGSRHHWFDMPNGQWVLDNVDLHFKLTEGFHSWIHMHGIHMLPTLRPLMDYNLSGWDGGSVMVNWYFPDEMNTRPQNIEQRRHPMNFPVDDDALTAEIYRRLLVRFTWPGLNEGEERMLLDAPIGQELIGRAYHSFRNEYQRYQKYRQERRAEFFYLNNFCFRLTGNMITFQRSHMEVRFPFWDYDLIDFLCGLRPMLRYDRLMYRTMITRELPALARIPMDDGEVLPTVQQPLHNLHSLSMRVLRRLKLIPRRPTLYADYDAYLWTDLRPWAESILFDRRTESRGLTNPAFVRSLMARSVVDHETPMIGKIASLITLEMVMREYFD